MPKAGSLGLGLPPYRDFLWPNNILSFGQEFVMAPPINRQVRLKPRPKGIPQAENFEITEGSVPDLADRQFLARISGSGLSGLPRSGY
jgi:hypothetical protein